MIFGQLVQNFKKLPTYFIEKMTSWMVLLFNSVCCVNILMTLILFFIDVERMLRTSYKFSMKIWKGVIMGISFIFFLALHTILKQIVAILKCNDITE